MNKSRVQKESTEETITKVQAYQYAMAESMKLMIGTIENLMAAINILQERVAMLEMGIAEDRGPPGTDHGHTHSH